MSKKESEGVAEAGNSNPIENAKRLVLTPNGWRRKYELDFGHVEHLIQCINETGSYLAEKQFMRYVFGFLHVSGDDSMTEAPLDAIGILIGDIEFDLRENRSLENPELHKLPDGGIRVSANLLCGLVACHHATILRRIAERMIMGRSEMDSPNGHAPCAAASNAIRHHQVFLQALWMAQQRQLLLSFSKDGSFYAIG